MKNKRPEKIRAGTGGIGDHAPIVKFVFRQGRDIVTHDGDFNLDAWRQN